MNIFFKTIIVIFISTLAIDASILNTKHNLSASGPGDIKAVSETRICVFCHTPHNGSMAGKPLWNRATPVGNYAYTSEYMSRTNYPKIGNLGSLRDEPGSLSRQCLSCHDGTIAIGATYVIKGSILGDNIIEMRGLNAVGTLSDGDMGHLGTNLSLHHPVGVKYSPNIIVPFGVGSKTIELKQIPSDSVKLFNYNNEPYIECSSCHNPHTENKKFLRSQTNTNHGENINNLCNSCHDKDGWVGSTHQRTTKSYFESDLITKYGTNSIASLGCINCHTPHNAEGQPSLLRKIEQNTCFQGASNSPITANCHGSGGAKDIESILTRAYSHPVMDIDGMHTNLDSLYGTNISDPAESYSLSWDTSKHAECMDCHNQHSVTPGTHVRAGQWYPNTPTNLVSNVLKGVSGVEPTWTPRGVQPTSFTTLASSEKEYQICLKCHSYWALGVASNGVSNHFLLNSGIAATDQAFEFNPNNRSAHPVIMSLNSMPGSYSPKALKSDQLLPPWSSSAGNNLMYCSDCHGADNEDSGDLKGPHGSNHKFMLKGPNKYWPEGPDGKLYTLQDIQNQTGSDGIFCANCHDLSKAKVHKNKANLGMSLACVNCHVAVPHGSPVSRLIGYKSFPEPYNYNGTSLRLEGFRKNPEGYLHDNAYALPGNGCNCHSTNAGAYDSYP